MASRLIPLVTCQNEFFAEIKSVSFKSKNGWRFPTGNLT
jgi:hypothetical protein